MLPSVNEWLSEKNVLITGVTGFLGKGILEKLLRECPTLGTVYVILRPKRGRSVEDRFQELKNSKIFHFLGDIYNWDKVVPIKADTSVSGLGLSAEDIKTLQENVQIVYHVAATVKFNEPFIEAIKINVRITRDLVNLALEMKNIEVFAHVSTAFANMDRSFIEENVYPPKLDWSKAIQAAETVNPRMLNALTRKLTGECGNTYVFSKQLAESVVWDHRHKLPVLIYRPPVVLATKAEPQPGWTDNLSGSEMTVIGIGKGVIRVILANDKIKIPNCYCDIAVNTLIAASWKLACRDKITGQEPDQVLTCSTSFITLKDSVAIGRRTIKEYPIPDILWTDYYIPVTNRTIFWAAHLLINVLPALIVTMIAKAAGKKNIPLLKLLRKVYYLFDDVLYKIMSESQLHLDIKNVDKLKASMTEEDQKKYDVDTLQEGENVIEITSKLALKNLLVFMGEREVSKEDALKHQQRMIFLDKACRVILVGLVLWNFPYSILYNVNESITNYFLDIVTIN